jgi:hypothetical protein
MGGGLMTVSKKKIGPEQWVLYDEETGETTPVREEAALEARMEAPDDEETQG